MDDDASMPPLNWTALHAAGHAGNLMTLLDGLPRSRWFEQTRNKVTLLHLACRGDNQAAVVALLLHGLDVNALNDIRWNAAHHAAQTSQPRVLELLCAAGVELRACNSSRMTPLDGVLCIRSPRAQPCARVLVANGARLESVHEACRPFITLELEAFERGVLRCRAAVVALLRVKRAGKLVRWDKFLLLEIAVCIWSTRYDKGWQTV